MPGVEYIIENGKAFVSPLMVFHEKGTYIVVNLHGARTFGMVYKIYERYGRRFIATPCPTIGLWFGKFTKGIKVEYNGNLKKIICSYK